MRSSVVCLSLLCSLLSHFCMHMLSLLPRRPLLFGLGATGIHRTLTVVLPLHATSEIPKKELSSPVRRKRIWFLARVAVPLFFDVDLLADRRQLKDAEIADGAQHNVVATLQGAGGKGQPFLSVGDHTGYHLSPQKGMIRLMGLTVSSSTPRSARRALAHISSETAAGPPRPTRCSSSRPMPRAIGARFFVANRDRA